MRVIEPEQISTQFTPALFALQVIAIADAETSARPFFSDVRQSQGVRHHTIAADERATALVRIRLRTVRSNGLGHSGLK
jgi:hypothetical protein